MRCTVVRRFRAGRRLGLALWLTISAQAAAFDDRQPIHIESDSLDIDDVRGISIYRGNVELRQGEGRMWADQMTLYTTAEQALDKIIAEGRPARFMDRTDKGDDINGAAQRIEYHAIQLMVVLDGEAHLEQNKNEFFGNRIEYEMNSRVVRAGLAAGDDGNGKGRVRTLILPKNAGDDGGSTAAQ